MFEGLLRNGWWYTSSSNTSNSINSYLLWNIFFKNSVNVIFTMCANKFLHLNIFSFFFSSDISGFSTQFFSLGSLEFSNSFPLGALNLLSPSTLLSSFHYSWILSFLLMLWMPVTVYQVKLPLQKQLWKNSTLFNAGYDV